MSQKLRGRQKKSVPVHVSLSHGEEKSLRSAKQTPIWRVQGRTGVVRKFYTRAAGSGDACFVSLSTNRYRYWNDWN
jgi:hypothetical protein